MLFESLSDLKNLIFIYQLRKFIKRLKKKDQVLQKNFKKRKIFSLTNNTKKFKAESMKANPLHQTILKIQRQIKKMLILIRLQIQICIWGLLLVILNLTLLVSSVRLQVDFRRS